MINLIVSLLIADLLLLITRFNGLEAMLFSGFIGINLMLFTIGVAIIKNNEK